MAVNDNIPGEDLSEDQEFDADLAGTSEEQRKALKRQIRRTKFSDFARSSAGRFLRRVAGVPESQLGPTLAQRRQANYEAEQARLSGMQTRLRKDQSAFRDELLVLEDAERAFGQQVLSEAIDVATKGSEAKRAAANSAVDLSRSLMSATKYQVDPNTGKLADTADRRVSLAAAAVVKNASNRANYTPMSAEINKAIEGLNSVEELKQFKTQLVYQLNRVMTSPASDPDDFEGTDLADFAALSEEEVRDRLNEEQGYLPLIDGEIAEREVTNKRRFARGVKQDPVAMALLASGEPDRINEYAKSKIEAIEGDPDVKAALQEIVEARGAESLEDLVNKQFRTQRALVSQSQQSLEAGKGQLYRDSKSELMQMGAIQDGARRANMSPSAYIDYMADKADARHAKTQAASPQSKAEAKNVDAITESAGTPGGVALNIPAGIPPVIEEDTKPGPFLSLAPSEGTLDKIPTGTSSETALATKDRKAVDNVLQRLKEQGVIRRDLQSN